MYFICFSEYLTKVFCCLKLTTDWNLGSNRRILHIVPPPPTPTVSSRLLCGTYSKCNPGWSFLPFHMPTWKWVVYKCNFYLDKPREEHDAITCPYCCQLSIWALRWIQLLIKLYCTMSDSLKSKWSSYVWSHWALKGGRASGALVSPPPHQRLHVAPPSVHSHLPLFKNKVHTHAAHTQTSTESYNNSHKDTPSHRGVRCHPSFFLTDGFSQHDRYEPNNTSREFRSSPL